MKKMNGTQALTYWLQLHHAAPDDLAAVCFPDKPPYFNRFFDRMQRWTLNRALRHLNVPLLDRRVLDLGCGRGRWLEFWNRLGAQAQGIDISPDAVEYCRSRGLEARLGSVEQLPWDDQSQDLVSSITVLLHLPAAQKEAAVGEMARVLKPGGQAILIENTWNDPSPHVFGLPVAEWDKLFEQAGLKRTFIAGHCFNLVRRHLPPIPLHDRLSIALDYPLEWFLARRHWGKSTPLALQHLMVYAK